MDVTRVLTMLRRRWLAVVLFSVVGIAAGLAHYVLTPAQFRASVTVILTVRDGESVRDVVDGGLYARDILPSYVELATTPSVLDPVIEDLDLSISTRDLADKVDVEADTGSLLATISVLDGDRQVASRVAEAIGEQLATTVRELTSTGINQAYPVTVTVVTPAAAPLEPVSPNLIRDLVLGLLAGGAVGGLLLYLRETSALLVRDRQDIARETAAPVIAGLPRQNRRRSRLLAIDTHRQTLRSESYRILRTSLLLRISAGTHTVAVVSPRSAAACADLVANLAVSTAHTGRKVLVIDADLKHPRLHTLFKLANERGLSDVLTGGATSTEAKQGWVGQWTTAGLDVLTAGPLPSDAGELIASPRMSDLIAETAKKYDLVLIATAAVLEDSASLAIAGTADATVLLIDTERTPARQLSETLARLELTEASLLGVVLDNVVGPTQREDAEGRARVAPTAPGEDSTAGDQAVDDPITTSIELAEVRRRVHEMRRQGKPDERP